jgi:hypothetical protein
MCERAGKRALAHAASDRSVRREGSGLAYADEVDGRDCLGLPYVRSSVGILKGF